MKKNAPSIIISLLMVMLLSSCSVWKTYPIELPESDDVVSISVMSGDKTASCTDEAWIEEIMSILTDVKAVLCAVLVIALAVKVFPVYITKLQLDNFADELIRGAENKELSIARWNFFMNRYRESASHR